MTQEPATGFREDPSEDVRDFVTAYFKALADGDRSRIDAMLAPCFQIVRGDGTILDRGGFIDGGLPDVRSTPVIRNLVVTSAGELLVASLVLDIEQSIGGRRVQSGANQLVTIRRTATGLQFVSVANLALPQAEVEAEARAMQRLACVAIRPNSEIRRVQGTVHADGINRDTAATRALSLQVVTIPAEAIGRAHLHPNHETALYVLDGAAATLWGEALENVHHHVPGEMFYIPAGMPHLPINPGQTPARAVIARSDAAASEDVVLRPDLEQKAQAVLDSLCRP